MLHAALVASAIYVPGVRSALNIAYMFSDAQYVDEDYNRTAVGERAQMIDLAHEKFQYPEGYFATGETIPPDLLAAQIISMTPPPAPVYIPPKPSPQPSPTPSPSPTPQLRLRPAPRLRLPAARPALKRPRPRPRRRRRRN